MLLSFAFFRQCWVVHDCQGDVHVENESSEKRIGDEGSLICTWFFKTLYLDLLLSTMNKEEFLCRVSLSESS